MRVSPRIRDFIPPVLSKPCTIIGIMQWKQTLRKRIFSGFYAWFDSLWLYLCHADRRTMRLSSGFHLCLWLSMSLSTSMSLSLSVSFRLPVALSQFLKRRPTHMRILRVRKFYCWRYRICSFAEFTKNCRNKGEVITGRRVLYSHHSFIESVLKKCYIHTYVCIIVLLKQT